MSDSFATSCTIALQAPPSMGFSRQESWSGLPFPPPGDLPDPGIEPYLSCLLHWQDCHLGSPQKWVTSEESQSAHRGARHHQEGQNFPETNVTGRLHSVAMSQLPADANPLSEEISARVKFGKT